MLKKDPYIYENIIEGFIYSTKVTSEFLENLGESRRVTELTQPIDLAPTILTMLGVDYEQETYLGSAVINKSVVEPSRKSGSGVMYSFYYGYAESDNLKSDDGENITAFNPNYTPTDEELKQFKLDYKEFFTKYYYVKERIVEFVLGE